MATRSHHVRARPVAAAAAAAILVTSMAFALPASAGHGIDTPGGPYRGFAHGGVIHVDAITTQTMRALNVDVGVANAMVDSEGLRKVLSEYDRPIVPSEKQEKHSRANSTVLEVGAVLQGPDAENQLKPWAAEVDAPGSEETEEASVLNTNVATALHVSLVRRAATARWNASTCVLGEPIAVGEQHLARLELVETGDDPDTPTAAGFDRSLAGLDATRGGPPRASSHVVSKQQLFDGPGSGFGLQSVVATTLAPVTFLEGTANEFTVEVDGPAFLSASADGAAGGAEAIYRAPIVSVIQNGRVSQVAPTSPVNVRVPATGDTVAQVKLGVIESLPAPKGLGGDDTERASGTLAAAQAHVVEVKLLHLSAGRTLTYALGHMEAAALVPPGGITCPIPVRKVAAPEQVSVGEGFTTTITVENPFACPITDVSLDDDITTEEAARFAVTGTSPAADAVTGGSGLATGEVRWADLGTIDPGKTTSAKVDLEAQAGAGKIIDTATATGVLENCAAGRGDAEADVSALTEVRVPVTGLGGPVETDATRVLGAEFLPATGIVVVVAGVYGLGLVLAGAALRLAARRQA